MAGTTNQDCLLSTLESDVVHVLAGHNKMCVGFSVDSRGGGLLLIHRRAFSSISLDVIRIRDGIWFAFGYGPVASGNPEVKGGDAGKRAPGVISLIIEVRLL